MRNRQTIIAAAFASALVAGLPAPLAAQDSLIISGNDAGVEAASSGDFAKAVSVWKPLADAGDADAQYNLAQAYKFGRGVETDLAEAERYYGLAAKQGHWRAADNYGLLLFHRGAKADAMPFLQDAAMRGDARAQYLYGLALFNGDLVGKDWVRAYALVTLAQNAGLGQATRARVQMDDFIPIEQRRRGVALSSDIAEQSEARRQQQADAADYGIPTPPQTAAVTPTPVPAPRQTTPRATPSSPDAAGADYTLPPAEARADATTPTPTPSVQPRPAPAPRDSAPAAPDPKPAAMTGPWKIQLGAFSVANGADRLWARLESNPALAGAQKVLDRSGNITRLKAGGYPTRSAAQAACNSLKAGGQDCLVTR
ncbi:SPOR domain-containing protein [Pseudoblastomonas halimionae]|uniref:Sporulation protein n=1 Tax=Alteriqipengyuania halimionae TaxID=1926630 RepID=A0A6I4TYY0_9SPHN|nr:SPOR domain-containing protein [Alteriqipengyuania halimionae]MXP08736.1 sporulation protein [Alteriqipengyuania halimionae]